MFGVVRLKSSHLDLVHKMIKNGTLLIIISTSESCALKFTSEARCTTQNCSAQTHVLCWRDRVHNNRLEHRTLTERSSRTPNASIDTDGREHGIINGDLSKFRHIEQARGWHAAHAYADEKICTVAAEKRSCPTMREILAGQTETDVSRVFLTDGGLLGTNLQRKVSLPRPPFLGSYRRIVGKKRSQRTWW
jgi:hypothetical protein